MKHVPKSLFESWAMLPSFGNKCMPRPQPGCGSLEVLYIPAIRLGSLDGFATTVVAFTTDIPAFDGSWGQPFLIGPGSIHVAHTTEERIPKAEFLEAVGIYRKLVERLLQ